MFFKSFFIMVALILPGSTVPGHVAITEYQKGERYHAKAVGIIKAPGQHVWDVLNDYDNHARYMPGAVASSRLSGTDNQFRVYKKISVFHKRIEYILTVRNDQESMESRYELEKGPFRENSGTWKIVDRGDGTCQLSYVLKIAPDFSMPGFMQSLVYRQTFRDFYRAVQQECTRKMKRSKH